MDHRRGRRCRRRPRRRHRRRRRRRHHLFYTGLGYLLFRRGPSLTNQNQFFLLLLIRRAF